MEKILTIVVPTYNMEALLPRCLDSFIIEEPFLEQMEVLIVNDGSKDASSEIAHKYASKYPNTFIVIDKPNGNYGSCINAALKVATGKYFKICDADDCYENGNLKDYVQFLGSVYTDIVFSPFDVYHGDTLQMPFVVSEELGDRIYNIDELQWDRPDLIRFRAMHCMATKREVLVRNNYYQTEGISYTDTQFIFYSDLYSKDCVFYNKVIYKYFLGRDGQTMSKASLVKSYMHFYENAKRMIGEYIKYETPISQNRAKLLDRSIAACLGFFLMVVICYLPYKKQNINMGMDLLDTLEKSDKLDGVEIPLNEMKCYRLWRHHGISPILIKIILQYDRFCGYLKRLIRYFVPKKQ